MDPIELLFQIQLWRIQKVLASPYPLHSTGPKRPDLDSQETHRPTKRAKA